MAVRLLVLASVLVACGGSWMVTKELIAAKQFGRITEITKDAVQRAEKARPAGK